LVVLVAELLFWAKWSLMALIRAKFVWSLVPPTTDEGHAKLETTSNKYLSSKMSPPSPPFPLPTIPLFHSFSYNQFTICKIAGTIEEVSIPILI
jgi:hypothetical protein